MGAKSGKGRRRVVEIYGKAGREGKGKEVERRVRNGGKEKEVFAFGVELLQRAAQRISPGSLWTSQTGVTRQVPNHVTLTPLSVSIA